ncbi:WAT1-related protein [Panicum miliaceum]|uniref:WAT1-related protein n=1 Tax=Panicum miliaceum TaxID=4540 RepID=A0A3L6TA81_PANMI|nr:WAT1-related protein [Panicum miliaceum]
MVLVQLFQTGLVLLSKVVIGHGMFVFALVTYRSAFGAAFLLPFALVCERCSSSPSPAARFICSSSYINV